MILSWDADLTTWSGVFTVDPAAGCSRAAPHHGPLTMSCVSTNPPQLYFIARKTLPSWVGFHRLTLTNIVAFCSPWASYVLTWCIGSFTWIYRKPWCQTLFCWAALRAGWTGMCSGMWAVFSVTAVRHNALCSMNIYSVQSLILGKV